MYNSTNTNYSTTLYNKCAIMKFNVTGCNANDVVTITGMNNIVTVDFSKNTIGSAVNPYTYSKSGSGDIALHNEDNGERWAILLPQAEVTEAAAYAAGHVSTSAFTVPGVSTNGYYANGVNISMVLPYIDAEFTVGSTPEGGVTKVKFSRGNLQYTKSTGTWSFMAHQYDMVETEQQDVGTNYENQGIVSLFGWGTSGNDYGAAAFQPWSTSNTNGAAYGPSTGDLTGESDWGVAAANDLGSGWRTLTTEEWQYVFNLRKTPSNIRYAKATVNNVSGVILLPDDWDASTYTLNSTNFTGANFSTNTITANAWPTLEDAGAVFLPAAGYRRGTTVEGSYGNYWTASTRSSNSAYCMFFNNIRLEPGSNNIRYGGVSVRLVRDAN